MSASLIIMIMEGVNEKTIDDEPKSSAERMKFGVVQRGRCTAAAATEPERLQALRVPSPRIEAEY